MRDWSSGDSLTMLAEEFCIRRRANETDDGLRHRVNRVLQQQPGEVFAPPQPWRRLAALARCSCGRVVKVRGIGAVVHQYEPHDCTARRGRALGLAPVKRGDPDEWLDLRIEKRREAGE